MKELERLLKDIKDSKTIDEIDIRKLSSDKKGDKTEGKTDSFDIKLDQGIDERVELTSKKEKEEKSDIDSPREKVNPKKPENKRIDNLLKGLSKKDKKTISKIVAFYSISKKGSYSPEGQRIYITQIRNYVYEGVDASGLFVPMLQTFYISDTKTRDNEASKRRPEMVSYRDVSEIQRAAKMNIGTNNNYLDPEIMDRYKIWKLFSFNFDIATRIYNNVGS